MNDLVAFFIARVKNSINAKHRTIHGIQSSKLVEGVADVLKSAGYIEDYRTTEIGAKKTLSVDLKYIDSKKQKNAIKEIKKVSKLGRRIYAGADEIPYVRNGLGCMVVSTSSGVMTDEKAREKNIGGELICKVW
ncbi:MAG: 30S ribosomal protein S8 [bacterium]